MPTKPARPCASCGALTNNIIRLCDTHLQQRTQHINATRGTSSERGYDARWQKARHIYLQQHPLCVVCKSLGQLVPATTVDHIRPHRGDYTLMWDESNWQALCTRHHSIKTAQYDGAYGNKETR
jgi:5-methylcytosine-specific restriction protein A